MHSFLREERKKLQLAHASQLSLLAKQIKIADKICNISDISETQPLDWTRQRKRDYLDWAEAVVGACHGCNRLLEAYFDVVLSERRQFLDEARLG